MDSRKKSTIILSVIALFIIAYIIMVNILKSNTQKRIDRISQERPLLSDAKKDIEKNEEQQNYTLQDNSLFFSFDYPQNWTCEKDLEDGNSVIYYLENSRKDDFVTITVLNVEYNVSDWMNELKKDWQSDYQIKKMEMPKTQIIGNNPWLCSSLELLEDRTLIKCFCSLLSRNGLSIMVFETTDRSKFEEKARNTILETFSFKNKDSRKESWDEESAVYTNYENGFAWSLPRSGNWEKVSGTSKNTIFKAIESETQITAYIGLTPIDFNGSIPKDFDSWKMYDSMLDAAETKKEEAKKRGQEVFSDDLTKTVYCGKHAIKERSIFTEAHGTKQMKVIQISYSFYYNGNILGVSVKSNYDVYKKLFDSFDVESILDGFCLTFSDTNKDEFIEKVDNKKLIKQL